MSNWDARGAVMVSESQAESSGETALNGRLGYLLKHAQLRFADISADSLKETEVSGRQAAVLALASDGEPRSQQELAVALGIDRTTMVAILDELEAAGLIARHPDRSDRRRNVVELTSKGARILEAAEAARVDAESRFFAELAGPEREAFLGTLRRLVIS
ncbi:MAG TPA: MarR family transcriptional regulator [Humibacter sp.]|jgi:DNA-binding MarR family transcriptional regulator|nr:MarR family transcriptional regulator [Humibacter sp.]